MLPANYKVPESPSQFIKLKEGVNKFRFMSDVVIGWEGWKDRKPFRHEGLECRITADQVDKNQSGDPSIKHFWAMVVWDYQNKAIKILELTQKRIMSAIEALEQSEDWGDCKGYDITINAVGAGTKEVVYTVQPTPPKKVSTEIENAYIEAKVDLQKLFKGEYPMEKTVHVDDETGEEVPFPLS